MANEKTPRDWAAIGINWITEPVQKQHGDHYTDRHVVGNAELPQIADIDLVAKSGVSILAWLNASNSMRVRAQAIARTHKGTAEELREKVFAALLGQRQSGFGTKTITVVKRPLPNGEMYEGTDENEFRQLYAAALVDSGVNADVALQIATTITF